MPPPASVGVLDLCGLDKAPQAGLDELLTNYAAEKLHAQLAALLESPALPGVSLALDEWAERPRGDRRWTVVALLEQTPVGLLHAVDRQSKTPDATDESLCALLAAAHSGKPCLQIDNSKSLTIHHFDQSDSLSYTLEGFLERNRCEAASSRECRRLLLGSWSELVRELADEPTSGGAAPPARSGDGAPLPPRVRPSACRDLLRELADAFTLVGSSDCAIVACVRLADEPEPAAAPAGAPRRKLDDGLLAAQLRQLRLVDWSARGRLGLSCRLDCDDLSARFGKLLQRELAAAGPLRGMRDLSPPALGTTIALACGLAPADFWVCGRHLCFRSGSSPLLQRLTELSTSEALPALAKALTRHAPLIGKPHV